MLPGELGQERRKWFHPLSALIGFLAGALLLGVASCYFLAQVALGIGMGEAMTSPQNFTVLHSLPSSSGEATAYVISDDCGATCGCTARVDIDFADQYFHEAYRNHDLCDLEILWASDTLLEIRDSHSAGSHLATVDIDLLERGGP